MNENVYIAILVASIATFLCRFSGVFFSSKLEISGRFIELIKCISIGIIVAVIAKLIIFPVGLLNSSLLLSRIIGVTTLFLTFYIFKGNVFLSTAFGTISFYIFDILYKII